MSRTTAATPKGRRSSAALRAAAAKVFAERGFLNATIAEIAEEAGRSTTAFHYYFQTKEGVLAALFQDFNDAVRNSTEPSLDEFASPEEKVRHLIDRFWVTYKEWRAVLRPILQLSMVDQRFYEQWRSIRLDTVDSIRALVRDAVGDLDGDSPIDAEYTASALAAMLDGFCYMWLVGRGDLPGVELDDERAQRTLTALILRALYPDSGEADSPAALRSNGATKR